MLDDAASRREGQLFTLINGDMVLLFPSSDGGVGLSAAVAQLFAPDAPDPAILLSRWLLPYDLKELSAFLDAVPTIAAAPLGPEQDSGLAAVTALFNAVDSRRIRELLERQTGVLVTLTGAGRVIPLFRELRFSLPALEVRAAAFGHVTADPFLFRHLIAKLDGAMLEAAIDDLDRNRTMLAWARGGKSVLHVNMSLEAVLSSAFTQLAEAAERAEARIAIEIALLEGFADTDAFVLARERIHEAGFSLVLDDVSHHALMVTSLAALSPDLLKLEWTRQIPQAGEALDAALQAVGPAKIILHKADTEEAVRWGIARGIRRFQGRHIDAILAAGRLAACSKAGRCTMRKCIEREGATTSAGRAGCGNLALLDAAAPAAEQVAS